MSVLEALGLVALVPVFSAAGYFGTAWLATRKPKRQSVPGRPTFVVPRELTLADHEWLARHLALAGGGERHRLVPTVPPDGVVGYHEDGHTVVYVGKGVSASKARELRQRELAGERLAPGERAALDRYFGTRP